jgi:cytochrome P450
MLVSELELREFDYTDPSLRGKRFHAAMAELRGPVAGRSSIGPQAQRQADAVGEGWLARGPYGYMVFDREAAEFFLRTRAASFPGMKIAEIFGVSSGPLYEQMKRNILHVNGPDHARLRGLVNPALSPRAVERYRPAMREFLEGLWADVLNGSSTSSASDGADGGAPVRCEFVEAFAKRYPSQVIATVMGAPLADAPRLHHWSNWIQRQFDATSMATEREQIEQAVAEFYEYAEGLLSECRRAPGDNLMSELLAATYQDDESDPAHPAERLSDVECINLVFNVLAGGVDTTQSQLAHAIRLLAEHPEQWRSLVADPALAQAAVEEALRFEPITPFTARITSEELTYRDVTFPEGTIMMVCAFTGNRDLTADEQGEGGPDSFDITVERPHARSLTFGAGVHYCVGANLARLELTEALSFLAGHAREVELDGEPVFESITGIYGLAELPLRFTLA